MIDNYLLEELVAFKKYGTLAATAEQLGLSQPAITRGTKKLEEEMGLKLFERGPNRIVLTETGRFAAERAEQVLAVNRSYPLEVQRFDQSQKQITICSCAPGPLMLLDSLRLQNVSLNDEFVDEADGIDLLLQGQFTCVVTPYPLKDEQLESVYLGKERLTVNLNGFTDLASQTSVTFNQLQDLTFLVLRDIGIWADVIQREIPNAKFLYQDNQDNFEEIRNYSIFPFFTTNLAKVDPRWQKELTNDRIPVSITDEAAQMTFYANYLKSNKKRLTPVIDAWQDAWAEVD